MSKSQSTDKNDYSEKEAARRRDEVVRRMIATPPAPRKAKPKKKPVAT